MCTPSTRIRFACRFSCCLLSHFNITLLYGIHTSTYKDDVIWVGGALVWPGHIHIHAAERWPYGAQPPPNVVWQTGSQCVLTASWVHSHLYLGDPVTSGRMLIPDLNMAYDNITLFTTFLLSKDCHFSHDHIKPLVRTNTEEVFKQPNAVFCLLRTISLKDRCSLS